MTDAMTAPSSSETSDEPYVASEEAADAFQEPSPTPQALGDQPGPSEEVRAGNAGGHGSPRTSDEAEAALEYTTAFCGDCPVRDRCVEEACAIWWAEKAALAVLEAEATPHVAGVRSRGSVL